MEKVFVYGTLRRGYWNNCYLEGQKFISVAVTVNKFALFVDGRDIPFLTENKKEQANITGELWEIDENCFKELDYLEGYPHYYDRKEVEVMIPTGTEKAWVYYHKGMLAKTLRQFATPIPSGDYFDAVKPH